VGASLQLISASRHNALLGLPAHLSVATSSYQLLTHHHHHNYLHQPTWQCGGIESALDQHRLVLFRNQDDLSAAAQIELVKRFCSLESTFYKHPHSPHPDIFRVSKRRGGGCTHVGRSGWHIDGSFQEEGGFDMMTMHFVRALEGGCGTTLFAPLRETFASLEVSEDRAVTDGGGLALAANRLTWKQPQSTTTAAGVQALTLWRRHASLPPWAILPA
jgi:alpha-ketoglutarate-dependent taurine dioxygenase